MGMKQILVMMAAVVLVGCGVKEESKASIGENESKTSKPHALITQYGRYQGGYPAGAPVSHIEKTKIIPCKIGESFGIDVSFRNSFGASVVAKVDHPPIKQPDGELTTSSELINERIIADDFDILLTFHFIKGYEYELKTGDWKFTVFIDGKEVAKEDFKIVPVN